MIACVVCLFVALVAIAVGLCFKPKNNLISVLLHSALLVVLICLGICSAAYNDRFGGFEILLILSVVPLFLQICVLQPQNGKIEQNTVQTQNLPKNAQISAGNGKNNEIFASFGDYLIEFVYPAALLATSICLFFCGLYIGKESFYGVLVALATGMFITFLDAIIKKDYRGKNTKQIALHYAKNFVLFFATGFLLASALLALSYSFAAKNILFALGALTLAAHTIVQRYVKTKYNHLLLCTAYALMFVAVLI